MNIKNKRNDDDIEENAANQHLTVWNYLADISDFIQQILWSNKKETSTKQVQEWVE